MRRPDFLEGIYERALADSHTVADALISLPPVTAPEPAAEPDAPVSTSLSTTLAEQEGATQSTATQEAGAIQTGLLRSLP